MRNVDVNQAKLRRLLMLSVLVACQLILGRFAIGTRTIKVDFTFITMFLMGKWFGPVWAATGCAMADFIGATIINGGPFFIGFTVSAALTGLIMGLCFYHHQVSWLRVIVCQLVIMVLVNLFLNTVWVVILTHLSLSIILIPRLIKELIETPVQIVILYEVGNYRGIKNLTDRFFRS